MTVHADPQPRQRRALRPFWMLFLAAVAGVTAGAWLGARHLRAEYDAYRALIQPGTRVAGIDVGWLIPEEAKALVTRQVAEPYYRDFTLHYEDDAVSLSPQQDLGLQIHVDAMVDQAVAAGHAYEYWQGFWSWLRGEVIRSGIDVPLQVTFDESAAARALADVAQDLDRAPLEPMVDVQKATFIPGQPGRRLERDEAAALINERLPKPEEREAILPVALLEPDQSLARIESMLSTLVPVMDRPPTPPSFYTDTMPLSTTGGIAGTPPVTYTGELTWTLPQFAGYQGNLTSTVGFFFDLGSPGARFDVQKAVAQVEAALRAGVTTPITFEADPVPPPPPSPELLVPPLEQRLARFSGVYSLLVKNLDTGQVIYDHETDYVLSGMSVVKVGIMVEVYRHFKGVVDAQTHDELANMLGSESCNPCANRLLALIGGGSATAGAKQVTDTMRSLGLRNFYLCAPFRIVENWGDENLETEDVGPSASPRALALAAWSFNTAVTPRYDRCVRATPREMSNLLEMIQLGTLGKGTLVKLFPDWFSPEVCQEMVDIMAANDLRNMLGAGIPAEVKLAHKHGFAGYDVPWGDTRAEVGIVYSPEATWLVSFYIWEDSPWIDFGIVQPLYRDVSNLLYNYFNPHQPYWPPPQWTP